MIDPKSRQAVPAISFVGHSPASQASTSRRDRLAERAVGRDERRGRGRAVLGLAEQVRRDEPGIGAAVGEHRDLGRASEQVDADRPEELALRLGDVGVAGADDHVHRLEALDPVRQGGQRLDAADAEDLVRAGRDHRVELRRVDAVTLARRRDRDDPVDPRGLGRDDRHQRRGDERIQAAWRVGPDRCHGQVPVAEDRPLAASRPRGP